MEETNIPDQLTFHEPVPHSQSENRDLLYTVSRIISAVFTPFMVPFVAFVLLFGFTYLRIMPLQYKVAILAMIYCFTILLPMLAVYLFQKINGWGIRELGLRTPFHTLRFDDTQLYRLSADHVSHSFAPLYVRYCNGCTSLYGNLCNYQHEVENQYPYGQ